MPDVGVLQLTIHDNSEQAAGGLDSLSRKLANVKRNASGFDLSGVSGQIKNLVDSVKASDTTIQRLGTLFNAVANYKKLNGIKFDAKPFKELKGAIGDGLKFGTSGTQINQIRQAIAGDWGSGDAKDKAIETIKAIATAGESFASNGTAKAIKDVAAAIREYASAQKELSEVGGKLDVSKTIGEVVGANATPGKVMKLNLQQFGGGGVTDGLVTVTDTVQKASTEVDSFKAKVSALMNYLNHPSATNYNGFKEVANIATDAAGKNKDLIDSNKMLINEMNSVLNVPAMEKGGPFKYASDEVVHYRTMLANAKNDMEFWSREYDRIQKQIKYNGNTEERTNALGSAEKSFYVSAGKMEEYEAHLVRIEEYVNNVAAAQRDMFNASGDPSDQLQIFGSMEEMANRLGLSIDEVKRKLQDTYNSVYENQGTPVYTTIEEAAQSLGISVENVKRQLQETYDKVYGTSAGTPEMFERINEEANRTGGVIDLLRQKVAILQNEVSSGRTEKGTILSEKAIINAKIQIENLTQKIEKLESAKKNARGYGESLVESLVGDYSKIDLLTMKLTSMKQALADDINANKLNTEQIADRTMRIQDLVGKIEGLKNAQDSATQTTHGISGAFGILKAGISKMFPTLSGLLSRFKQIAKYRLLRGVLKHITEGFSEGVQNVYQYSKAIGSSFAPSMDSAASALLQMKNSIGAAAAPLIQSLIPVLQTVVSWFVTAINYVNQFLSLLRGQQTWTRALPATANAFGKQEKAARGAASAMKDLLADWDELNIIQSESGGGGGGVGTNAAEDYLKMFEETSQYENKIKSIVDYIKNNLDVVKKVAEGIGATILTWKLSKAFGNTLGFLKTLEVAAGITLLITGVEVAKGAGYDIGKNGINNDNLLGGIGGVLAEALGGGLVGVAFGGIKGGLIGLTVGTLIGLAILGANISEGAYDALYGDVKLTSEEIKREVDALFTFDVNAELTSATVDHQAIEKARNDVISEMQQMNADYITFKMKLTPEFALSLLASVNNVVDTTNTLLKGFQKKISLGFGFNVNYSDPEFVQQFSTDNLTSIDSYVTELGKGIGKILEDGVIDGVNEQSLLNDLMKKLQNVTRAISMGQTSGKFMAELEKDSYGRDWTNVSRESLQGYANRYTQLLEEAKQAGYLQAVDTQSALGGIYHGMLQRNIDEPGTYTQEELDQAEEKYMKYDVAKAIDEYVELATADGKQKFMENMMTAFHSAISKADISSQKRALTDDQSLKDWINKNMASNLGWGDDDFQKVMDSMGITGWDLLTKEYRRQYVNTIINALGSSSDTYRKMKNELGIPIEDILAVSQRSWDGWANRTRKGFIASLLDAYKGHEVLEAMKDIGYDLNDIVATSLLMNDASRESLYGTLAELYGPKALLEALSNAGIDAASYGITAEPIQIPAEIVPEGDYSIDTQIEMGSSDVYEQMKREIQDAVSDGIISTKESLDFMEKYGSQFGQGIYQDILKNMGIELDEEGYVVNGLNAGQSARNLNPDNLRASAGYSDANFGPYRGVTTIAPDDESLAASVKKGTEGANVSVITALNNLITAVNALGRRPVNVNLSPSSGFGMWGRRNGNLLANVTGTDEP